MENLFQLMKVMSDASTYDHFNELYNRCEIRYGDMKKQLAEDVIRFTTPFREKILDLQARPEYLDQVAGMGAEKARESASKTIRDVRRIIGFRR